MDYTIEDIINYESESHKLDFKREQYLLGNFDKKSELLKDFISFANHPSNEPKFIICGVDEKTKEILGVQNPVDEAQYREYISKNIEPEINFEYRIINLKDKKISYFKIFRNENRPYLFKKDLPNSRYNLGDGYIRIGTATKKIGRKELEDIYRNRLIQKDRKKDLIISSHVSDYHEFTKEGLKFYNLEVSIENISSKSIEFHVELKFDSGLAIIPKYELEHFVKSEKNSYNSVESLTHGRPFNYNVFVSSYETKSHILFTRNGAMQRGLKLEQRDIVMEVFQGAIILCQNSKQNVYGSLCIRSDAFLEGPLFEDIVFKV